MRVERAAISARAATSANAGAARADSHPPRVLAAGRPIHDPATATRRALEEPIGFPPLAAAVVPGDRVAIALEAALPRAADVLRGAIDALAEAGIERKSISVVTTDAELNARCSAALGVAPPGDVQFVVHDPDDPLELCPIGLTSRHEQLEINRTLYDADVVLPIGLARIDDYGVFDGLYPHFSSAAAIDRYRGTGDDAPSETCGPTQRFRETEEAGWLIGTPQVVQVVPGEGGTVAQVLAGDPRAVAQERERLSREMWSFRVPQRASLVVATVTGDEAGQSWHNVGRAVVAAERILADGGAIAICSNLACLPGKSLGRLVGSSDLEKTERKILRDRSDDSWAALQLVRALQRGPVYFLSQLEDELVEEMGLAPIADVDELARLAGRHESCAVLADSQFAIATVAGEEGDDEGDE